MEYQAGSFTNPHDEADLMPTAITLEHVSKTYGPVKALDDFSLEIPSGVVFGLLGPNGAGKTTAMRICSTLLAVLLAAVALVGVAYAAPDKEGTFTPDEALIKAIAIMGLDKDTPFLHDKINGREAFKIRLEQVPAVARKQNTDSIVMRVIRDFDVYLDTNTGQLIRIMSTLDTYEEKVKSGEIRFPSPEEAEEQLGSDEYLGLSKVTPPVGFLTVLSRTYGSLTCDLITAQLLQIDHFWRYNKAAWVVNLYGPVMIVPSPPRGRPVPSIPPYQLNHIRTVLDTTGRFLYGSNAPYATY